MNRSEPTHIDYKYEMAFWDRWHIVKRVLIVLATAALGITAVMLAWS